MSKLSPFDYIKIINSKGDIPLNLLGYDSFIVNKNYSHDMNYVFYANMINVGCDNQLNFDFYYSVLPKKRLFTKWSKKAKESASKKESLNNIIEYYNCSIDKARDIYTILEAENKLKQLAELCDKGGV